VTDLKEITKILIKRGKARGKPVAISLFKDRVPEEYEPLDGEPCSIVYEAMDNGRKVYFNADHYDCLVGVHHAGMIPGTQAITAGEYLSKTSNFFTYEGAARVKAGGLVLPPGMVTAIGAAPLDEVPEGVDVDWIVAVTNPHNANFMVGGRMAQEGVKPTCSFGNSLCEELFATPWHIRNNMVVGGDFGGRMHNKLKQDQLFVIIPMEFVDYIPCTLVDARVDVKASRTMTKPAHSPYWAKQERLAQKKKDRQAAGKSETAAVDDTNDAEGIDDVADTGDAEVAPEVTFSMPWADDAMAIIKKVPPEMMEMIVTNSENFAEENGYKAVSRKSIDEQMKALGMDLEEMLAMVE
jgi:uncharacterized protein (DUF169 family)